MWYLQAASVTSGQTHTHNQAHCTHQDGNTHHNWVFFLGLCQGGFLICFQVFFGPMVTLDSRIVQNARAVHRDHVPLLLRQEVDLVCEFSEILRFPRLNRSNFQVDFQVLRKVLFASFLALFTA